MITPPDMELWATKYIRSCLSSLGYDVEVSNKEPEDLSAADMTRPLVVIRDDSGAQESAVTYDRSLGVSVLWGSRQDDKTTGDIARLVMAIMADDGIAEAAGSPVASVERDGCNGPYSVTEQQDLHRKYMTVEYTIVGDIS
jgi:hypothetical protein